MSLQLCNVQFQKTNVYTNHLQSFGNCIDFLRGAHVHPRLDHMVLYILRIFMVDGTLFLTLALRYIDVWRAPGYTIQSTAVSLPIYSMLLQDYMPTRHFVTSKLT